MASRNKEYTTLATIDCIILYSTYSVAGQIFKPVLQYLNVFFKCQRISISNVNITVGLMVIIQMKNAGTWMESLNSVWVNVGELSFSSVTIMFTVPVLENRGNPDNKRLI
jgi:hypothetical protein